MDKNLLYINIGLAVVAIAVLAIGVFSSDASPQEVIAQSFQHSSALESISFEGSISINIANGNLGSVTPTPLGLQDTDQKTPLKFSISFNGSTETAQIKNPKTQMSILIDAGELQPFGIDARMIEGVTYLKLDDSNAPDAGLFSGLPLLENWVVFDPQAIARQLDVNATQIEKSDIEEKLQINKEGMQKIYSVLASAEFLKEIEELDEEKINGIESYHYRIIATNKELSEMFAQIENILGIKQTQKSAGRITKNENKDIRLEMWIGKEDYLPRKIAINTVQQEQNEAGSFSSEVMFSNFNQRVVVPVPKNTITIEEALDELFGEFMQYGQDDGSFYIESSPQIDINNLQENSNTADGVEFKIIE